jgi:polysaccharide export outer membrane protein
MPFRTPFRGDFLVRVVPRAEALGCFPYARRARGPDHSIIKLPELVYFPDNTCYYLPTNLKVQRLRFGLYLALPLFLWLFAGWLLPTGVGQVATDPAPRAERTTTSSAVAYTTSMNVLDDTRTLRVGDQLSVRILEDKKAPFFLTVTDSGEVEVPLIGRVSAKTKTCKSLAYAIKAPLERDYYYKATVIIGLDQAGLKSPGRVYLTGQVRTQGPLDIPPDEILTVSKAILRAGGFGDFANQKSVKLVRTRNGTTTTKIVNCVLIFKKAKVELDLPLERATRLLFPKSSSTSSAPIEISLWTNSPTV